MTLTEILQETIVPPARGHAVIDIDDQKERDEQFDSEDDHFFRCAGLR